MKVCALSFAILFSFYLCGVHGRSGYYERKIQPHRSEVEASSVNDEEELHVNDPEVVNLGTLVVDQLNTEKDENDEPLLLMEIVKASTKVLAANLTVLTLKVSQGGVSQTCEIKILREPLSHKIEMVHPNCGTIPAKYKSFGTITNDGQRQDSHDGDSAKEELDVGNAEVVRLSMIAVDELNKEIVEGSDPNNLLGIMRASVQAVSGKTSNLLVTLKVSQGHTIKICEVEIQHQVWLNETKVMESKCEEVRDETVPEASEETYESNDDHREGSVSNDSPSETFASEHKEREAVNDDNDEVDLNVNDQEVITLSAISLIELNVEKQENDPPLNLSKIVKAVLHKHSGKVTLTLEVLQGGTEDTCEFNLWEDSVVDKLDITHSKCGTVPAKVEIENTNRKDEELDVNDPEVIRLSVMAMTDLNEHYHHDPTKYDPVNLLEIVKVSRHIDSGKSTSLTLKVSQGHDIKMCDVTIFEKYMSHIPQVIESRCETIKKEEMYPEMYQITGDPGFHDVQVPGETDDYPKASDTFIYNDDQGEGIDSLEEEEELDVNDPEVIELSALGMVALNDEKLQGDDPLILLEIIKAATHLPSGNETSVTLKVSQGGIPYVCEMEFWPQPDMVEIKVRHSQCGTVPARLKTESDDTEQLLSGVEQLKVDDPMVIRLSMIALVKLYEKHPTNDPVNLLEIVKASRQLVSGTLTSLTLKVSQGGHKKMCDIQILEQPWLQVTDIIHSECENDDNLLEIYSVNGMAESIPLSKSVYSW